MSMEFHRGHARGPFRRQIKPISKQLPGANSYDSILLAGQSSGAGVWKLKSIWGVFQGYSTNSAAYAIGWHGFYRADAALSADPDINYPDILSPKPFLWNAQSQAPPLDLYLSAVNLAENEYLYWVVHIDYVGGSPSIFGQVKYAFDRQVF